MSQQQPESHTQLKLRANWVNMAIALGACMLVVFLALAFVPRPETEFERVVDHVAIAESVAGGEEGADFDLAVPTLPTDWVANEATYKPMGEPALVTWYASFIGPQQQWVSLRQAADTTGDWADSMLDDDMVESRTETVAGTEFTVHQNSGSRVAYVGTASDTTLVFIGTGTVESFEAVITSALDSLA
ncbi:DUF4245 domain-containing protein [Brevibacterium litoralis]|uniref:DUF4245 domain-containing protein n=1 Tax=Brevibacterium litoralis TaxID=3138935 RepID=UPI0032EE3413